MNKPVLFIKIICIILFIAVGWCAINILDDSYKHEIEKQLIECEKYEGDLSTTGVLKSSVCLIDGEKIKYIHTVNGWKLLKHNSKEVQDE